MVSADYLFLMTDVDCLYTSNPRKDPTATPIPVVTNISELQADTASVGSTLGTGGMNTKIVAAKLATSAGITVIITKSSKPGNVLAIVNHLQTLEQHVTSSDAVITSEPPLHTRFTPSSSPMKDRRFWLLHGLAPHGTIYIDEGAYTALSNRAGLLPVGIVDVEGQFAQQEAVKIVVVKRLQHMSMYSSLLESKSPLRNEYKTDTMVRAETPEQSESITSSPMPGTPAAGLASGGIGGYGTAFDVDMTTNTTTQIMSLASSYHSSSDVMSQTLVDSIDLSIPPEEVGRALVNYSSAEISRIKGLRSAEIAKVLGYADSEYVAYRENVSLIATSESKKHTHGTASTLSHPSASQGHDKRMGDLSSFA